MWHPKDTTSAQYTLLIVLVMVMVVLGVKAVITP